MRQSNNNYSQMCLDLLTVCMSIHELPAGVNYYVLLHIVHSIIRHADEYSTAAGYVQF